MPYRQPRPSRPTVWLMTDERMGDALWPALERLPRGAGIVFRHYTLDAHARRRLFDRVRTVARRRRLLLSLADMPAVAAAWRADGAHGPSRWRSPRPMVRSIACHDRMTLVAARRQAGMLCFVSPVHPTRSHPGRPALGVVRLGLLVGRKAGDVVTLGGMDGRRARSLRPLGIHRWAAIDAWT